MLRENLPFRRENLPRPLTAIGFKFGDGGERGAAAVRSVSWTNRPSATFPRGPEVWRRQYQRRAVHLVHHYDDAGAVEFRDCREAGRKTETG